MRRTIKKTIAVIMCVVMLVGFAPLSGFVGLEFPDFSSIFGTKASAEENTSGIYSSGDGWTIYNDGELVITKNPTYSYSTSTGAGSSSYSTSTWPWGTEYYYSAGYGGTSYWYGGTNRLSDNHLDCDPFNQIKTITICDGVTEIPECCFEFLKNLTDVSISDSVTKLGIGTFYGCDSLKNVEFGSKITEIPDSCFMRCPKLTMVSFSEDSTIISVDEQAFRECTSLKSLELPSTVQSIGDYAFYGCTSLTDFTVPDKLTVIGQYSFYKCQSLKEFNFPKGIQKIGYSSFGYCYALKSVVIEEGVTYLPSCTFDYCPALEKIAIPLSLKSVNQNDFRNCVSLDTVVYSGTEEYWNEINITTTGNEYFIGANKYFNHWHNNNTSTTLKNYKEPDCTTEGYSGDLTCNECGWVFSTGSVVPALGHNWQINTIPATATSGGYKYHICLRCAKSEMLETYDATTASFSASDLSVAIGETKALELTVTPEKYKDSVTYTSSNETVATVDETGNVTGIAVGTATITATTISGVSATCNVKVAKKSYAVGDIIEYGNYPQTKVTDTDLIAQLEVQDLNWVSYDYYSGTGPNVYGSMSPSTFMRYCDVAYNGNKYRGVYFSAYRPHTTTYPASTGTKDAYNQDQTYQANNGYYINTMYWFKYEPIRWKVLDIFGFVMCESLIDSQPFNNYFDGAYSDFANKYHANNYQYSDIRNWLNNDFYNTAFNTTQKANLISTNLGSYSDYVFLLTSSDLVNSSYGFSSVNTSSDTRVAYGTDYAKCQGLSSKNSWYSRSSGGSYDFAVGVVSGSTDAGGCLTYGTSYGIRPVMNLSKLMEDTSIDLTIETETCSHTAVTDAAVPAGCTTTGLTEGSHCSKCGEILVAQTIIPATGHSYTSVVTNPDCTTAGYTTYTCSKCTDSYKANYVSALGHNYVDEIVQSSCTGGGYTKHVCSRCQHEYTDNYTSAGSHDYATTTITPTCGADGYDLHTCKNCQYSYKDNIVPATGNHDYGEYIYNNDATTSSDGTKTAKCKNCDHEDTKTADGTKLHSHSYTAVITEPTCKNQGYTTYTCACGDTYKSNYTEIVACSYVVTETVTADCAKDGYVLHTCKWCGKSYKTDEVKASGHDWETLKVNATCTQVGGTLYSCKKCGFSKIEDKIEALGHNYKDTVVTATCETDGYTLHQCTRCSDNYKDNIVKATGHLDEPVTIQTTCIQDGYVLNICKYCGRTVKSDTAPATGHTFTEWTVTQDATETDEGLKQRHCTKCGYTEDKLISIIDRTTYTVTFIADCKPVATVEYVKGSKAVDEPAVPHKDRYDGKWESYTLNNKDITVNAVYTLIDLDTVKGIETDKNASYNSSTGEATINIYAASEGKTVVSTTSKKVPLDIVLVVDQSGSMADRLGGKNSKKQALINSATAFVNEVYKDASENGVDHRIAIVGFGMGCNSNGAEYPSYLNTEILTTGGSPIQMNDATADNYKNALMYVDNDGKLNANITTAINNIDAKGATAADYGLSMANSIFTYTDGTDRQRIVVFMTDGAPTYSSDFSSRVASSAILQANELKNTYGANIYSIGVMTSNEAKDININNFMNYVSSNYTDAQSISGEYTKSNDSYYFNVENTNNLSAIFTEIVTENITRTTDFDDITVIDTISKYFTMTSQQEKALRKSIIETYGVKNSDITITRSEDGTTTVMVKHLTPVENNDKFEINISFNVSANENAAKAGNYATNTEDAGIIIGNAENYECIFKAPSVTISTDRNIAKFTVNDEIYAIKAVTESETLTAPKTDFIGEYEFTGWTLDNGTKESAHCTVYNAVYVSKQNYVVVWNTDEGTIKVAYTPGEIIDEPTVLTNSSGSAFRRWNRTVPTVMPENSIEFTAVYGDHEHQYEAETIKAVTCVEDGQIKYTCTVCGDFYTETVECMGSHQWKAISGAVETETGYQEFICENCGESCSRTLEYSQKDSKENKNGKYDSVTNEFNYIDENGANQQPDGYVNITVPVNDYFEGAENVEVYRKNNDGSKTKCDSSYKDGIISMNVNHFSTYEFVATYANSEHEHSYNSVVTPPTCTDQGYTTHTCACGDSYIDSYVNALNHSFTNYIDDNNSHIGVDGTETAKCDRCTETHTRTKIGSAKGSPSYSIKNIRKYNGQTIDYKSSLTIYADVQNCTDVKWFVSGASYSTNSDGSVTINQATGTFSVYFTAKDLDGKEVKSETETVNVKSGFFDKLIAFFKGLFGSLPKLKQ